MSGFRGFKGFNGLRVRKVLGKKFESLGAPGLSAIGH